MAIRVILSAIWIVGYECEERIQEKSYHTATPGRIQLVPSRSLAMAKKGSGSSDNKKVKAKNAGEDLEKQTKVSSCNTSIIV